jgi:hypothetical protein
MRPLPARKRSAAATGSGSKHESADLARLSGAAGDAPDGRAAAVDSAAPRA